MADVYAMIADGTEEAEFVNVVDILKRAGLNVKTVSVMKRREIRGAHDIMITADAVADDIDFDDAKLIYLPGGMPGAENLAASEKLCDALKAFASANKKIAAICAAPAVVLGKLGLLDGKKATCYPGFESALSGAEVSQDGVVTSGNITTAKGPGFAMELGFEMVKLLCGEEASKKLKGEFQFCY